MPRERITHSESMAESSAQNWDGPRAGCYKGVTWDKRRNVWVAQLQVNGRCLVVSRTTDIEQAALDYDAAVLCYRKGEGYLNLLPHNDGP